MLQALYANTFLLLLSEEQFIELQDVFSRPSLLRRFRLPLEELVKLRASLDTAERITPREISSIVVRDTKDEHVLAAAIGGNADYLVTGDNDLLVLRDDARLGKLRIVTVAEFVAILDS